MLIAESLGYQPNSAARSLVSGRANIIGLILPTGHIFNEPYEAHVLESVASEATEASQGVMLWLAAGEPNVTVRNELRRGVVDGVVISGVALGAAWVEDLLDGPHPCVVVGRHPTRTDLATVEIDNAGGARRAVDHFVAGGHRRLAMVLGPDRRVDADDRETGFRAALADHGLALDESLVARGDFNTASGYEAVQLLLPNRPDAIFAANDLMAVGVLRALADAGVRVPADVGVIGFDDLPVAAASDPPLTTVSHDIAGVCSTAVALLLELISGEQGASVQRTTIVPTPLIVRASTRPVDSPEPKGAWEAVTSHAPAADPESDHENRRAAT